ncbi:TetR/AcrR family transcriptional regulator [Marivita hallyeonensis]|uniref:Transcriptional regulator, TetR family n=1 Tax=Marivita hallyeonensis TaxID=996342 RepID=A0A1M5W9M7_9RHOB|nr:TetR/AcrR family transcriptional regulator [Marivita hallyeonensis]SHH84175.1 transcriptional regulator, TetR family [Marivita hallyeonensis]
MRDEAKALRRAQIEAAAYDILAEKGFQNMSMLAVAKAAKASNETLYRWYGDKLGLFTALIDSNAEEVAKRLRHQIQASDIQESALSDIGRVLLTMLLGDRAIALNRAAAADATGTLGKTLAEAGRGRVFPLMVDLFSLLRDAYGWTEDPADLASLYVDLLVGDLQIRRATGALGPVSPEVIAERARRAERRLIALATVS